MAKRRNLKKEKALRNEAYARKFRKRNNKGQGRMRRRFMDNSRSDDDNAQDSSEAMEGAADT